MTEKSDEIKAVKLIREKQNKLNFSQEIIAKIRRKNFISDKPRQQRKRRNESKKLK